MWCSCFCTKCDAVKLFVLPDADPCVCSDSKAAEGAASGARPGPEGAADGARSDPEGVAREQQEAAAGVWPPGGAGERQSPTDGGGESATAAAGTERISWVGLPKMSDLYYSSPFLSSRLQMQSLVTSRWRKNSNSTESNRTSDLSTDCSQRSTYWL